MEHLKKQHHPRIIHNIQRPPPRRRLVLPSLPNRHHAMIPKNRRHNRDMLHLRKLLPRARTQALTPGNVRSLGRGNELLAAGTGRYPPRRAPDVAVFAPVFWVRLERVKVEVYGGVGGERDGLGIYGQGCGTRFGDFDLPEDGVVEADGFELGRGEFINLTVV